ncbi:MAG: c-type cytochrome [Acidobacteria bacterium]|nr:c-type cytochrome [Acidobacteriota bacterium]
MATAAVVLVVTVVVFAGQVAIGAQEKDQTQIKKAPMPHSKPESGAQMYKDYCAVCHGKDGRGDGPAAEILKSPPPSLRTLAKSNDGKYPDTKVRSVLMFGSANKAHRTSDMPFWGPTFRAEGGSNISELRISNLTKYIETLQDK